jgi:hypothetical protein
MQADINLMSALCELEKEIVGFNLEILLKKICMSVSGIIS